MNVFLTYPNMTDLSDNYARTSFYFMHQFELCCIYVTACLSPPVKIFTDRSKAVLLLWIFYVFSVLCLLCLCARLFICALWSPAGKGLTFWLSFVVPNCEFVTFPLVSWVRCGT